MTLGTSIRILLVLAWVGLFTTHALHYALPDLGLVQRHDLAAVIKANVGNSYTYSIRSAATKPSQPGMGTCTLTLEQVERGFKFTTRLLLTDPGLTKAAQLILGDASPDAHPGISLEIIEDYDDRYRLYALRGEGAAAGRTLIVEGRIANQGFVGTYRIDHQQMAPLHLPEITAQTGEGIDMAIFLPAGLRRGDKFSQLMMTPDLLQHTTHQSTAVFTVLGDEQVETIDHPMTLLHVNMEIAGTLDTTLWCDGSGTIYRALKHQSQILLLLKNKRAIDGERRILWPVAATAPKPGVRSP